LSKEPHIFFHATHLAPRRSTTKCEVKGCLFYVRSDVAIFPD